MADEQQNLKGMFRKLDELRARYDELSNQMNQPEIARDASRSRALAREHGNLKHIVEPYLEYLSAASAVEESRAIADDPEADADLQELAREELTAAEASAEALITSMKEALVTGEDAAVDSVIMEIRAGTGGEEAALFARNLYEMYQRYADRVGLRIEMLDSSASDMGGFKELILNIKGPEVYRKLGYEGGGHRVQRVPETESQGRVHTSAATVAVLPEAEEVDVQINWEKDVIEHVSRAGGPGGQNVNKVSSAIKLEHVPTGITVSMRDEKSQHKNRAKARRILITRLYETEMQAQRSERDASRKTMIGSGDRSQRIRTYNFPQNRCTDHRIGVDQNLDKVMAGELDELIEALQKYDVQQRLANL